MLRLRVLGTLQLDDQERGVSGDLLVQPKAVALLVYLALARPRGFQQRDRLVGLFWPDVDQERARTALRKTVHRIRQALSEDVVISRGNESLALGNGVWCDAVAFDAALEAGKLSDALGLYHGDLLPGFFVSDSGFEQWLEAERARFQSNAASAAWSLVERYDSDQAFTDATKLARVVARLARSDERMLRKVISLLHRRGDRAGALETYTTFAERLWREYETRPSQETVRLIELIMSSSE